jgi:hypothetical protein
MPFAAAMSISPSQGPTAVPKNQGRPAYGTLVIFRLPEGVRHQLLVPLQEIERLQFGKQRFALATEFFVVLGNGWKCQHPQRRVGPAHRLYATVS